MWALSFFALRAFQLRALTLAIWTAIAPAEAQSPDAEIIASAIGIAVASDPSPVESPEFETGLAAVFVHFESGVKEHPVPYVDPVSHRVADPFAKGPFQIRGPGGLGSVNSQGRVWVGMLHESYRVCHSTAALLSGNCHDARKMGEARAALARRLVDQVQARDAVAAADQDAGVN